MQKNEGSKVVKWILIAVSVLFAFVFLILPLYTVISVALRNGVGKYFQYITDKDTISAVKLTAKATLSALVVNTFFGLFAAWFLTTVLKAKGFEPTPKLDPKSNDWEVGFFMAKYSYEFKKKLYKNIWMV